VIVQQPVHSSTQLAPETYSSADSRPSPAGDSPLYILALVVAIGVLGIGIYLAVEGKGWAMLAAGCGSLVAVLVTWPLARAIVSTREAEARRREDLGTILSERLQQLSVLLNVVSEQQLLSDRAKQVAFRDKDRDALRRAIKEDLLRKDWEAALALVTDMESTFGYKQEAEQYREEINNHRQETVRRQIQDVAAKIDTFCRQEKWSEALRESEKLHRHFPENEQVQKLPQEIENRRQGTKRQLLDAWHEAIARKDVDSSIEIVRKLDAYLTRQEAESMQEAARGVFKEKLNQLAAQFTLAVQDKKYPEAIRAAEIITRDFPNSGIAREVRDMMESLRTRAGEPEMAKA
jgi:hypothetical protein